MSETRRQLEAARALSALLRNNGIPHAFHGNLLTAVLSNSPQSDEIFCIVEGGPTHPFRRVRQAIVRNEEFTAIHSPWSNRLHATYRGFIPAIEIEILPAGEEGPRRLDSTTVMLMQEVPFLTISEFIRAKLKSWVIRGLERDAQDIIYAFRYWNQVDINRIPEQDMNNFVERYRAAARGWVAVQRKYGMQ